MKQNLSEQERQHLDQRVVDTEKRTGAQVVLAVIERSDQGVPWLDRFATRTTLIVTGLFSAARNRPADRKKMTKISLLLAFCVLCSSCSYPVFQRTPEEYLQPNPAIPPAWDALMNDRLTSCTGKLDDARHDAWEAKKSIYVAATIGSLVALMFGGAAGALGVAAQKTLSSVAGTVAAGVGIFQIASVDKKQMEDETKKEFIMITTWDGVKTRITDFRHILVEQYGLEATLENIAVRQRAFRNMNYAFSACKVEPLTTGDFIIQPHADAAEQIKQRNLLKGLE